jgi:ribonuclease BN (tRNA processing enzyme)
MPGVTLEVRFLGSGDAFGSGGRFQACILLSAGTSQLLLDCGASSLIAMKRAGVNPSTIEHVLISHLHGDHFGGLPFMILDGQFSRRTQPLTIAGPPGSKERLPQAMEALFPGSSQVERAFDIQVVELSEGCEAQMGGAVVQPFAVEHASGAPAYAYRIRHAGRTVAYSGDTQWTDVLIDAADDADLFICEAYFFDKRIRYHLDYSTIEKERSRLNCRRVIITHMSADMLSRLDGLNVEAAFDGLLIQL